MEQKQARNRAIYDARLAGKTFREIAELHEISAPRAREIFARERIVVGTRLRSSGIAPVSASQVS